MVKGLGIRVYDSGFIFVALYCRLYTLGFRV
jgi:hypothetical protein